MMTEKQKKLKAERDRRYREKKKLEKAAESDLQAQIDPAPESAMQAPDSELQERYKKEFQAEPVLEVPLTDFDVYKRRHEGMFK
jgi:hypothetical protein